MQLTALFMLAICLQLSARVASQTIHYSAENVSLEKVFGVIKAQTGYSVFYNKEILKNTRPVTVHADHLPLEKFLQIIFQRQPLTFTLEDGVVAVRRKPAVASPVISDTPLAKTPPVTGLVTDHRGEPLSGVNIVLKGSSAGTMTDAEGRFSISANPGAILVFSYVGYETKEITLDASGPLNIRLNTSTAGLTDVVVIGYGAQQRKDLIGTVGHVGGSELAKQPVQTPTQALQGKVAGVQVIASGQPNSLPIVRVRGTGTMLGGNNPLYVVDGIITDDIRNINTADILSMDVLKDASATAIYGMRAANGVLLITTKKGKAGRLQLNYDGLVGLKEPAHLVKMAGTQQYAGYLNEASVYYGTGDSLIPSSFIADGYNTDWFDAIIRRGVQQNHNISFSGGSDKVTYFFSAGYFGEEGLLETNRFKRFTLRSNTDYILTKGITLSALISYSRSQLNDINLAQFNNAYRSAPFVPAKINGKYGNTSLSNNVGNALLNLELNPNLKYENRLQSTVSLDMKLVPWLTLRSSFGGDLKLNDRKGYSYGFTNTGPNSVFIINGGNQLYPESSLFVERTNATKWVWDNTAAFSKKFGDHSLNLLTGMTAEQYLLNSLNAFRYGVPADPDQWYLDAGNTIGQTNNNSGDKWTRNSFFGRLNYNYNNRYLLTATLRADGTSRFPEQNRWGYFPSAGIGWNIHREPFMSRQQTFSNLKLRFSWGRVGNDGIPSSVYLPLAVVNIPYFFDGQQQLGIAFDQLPDRNVRWETTEETNLGLDFGLFAGRLSGQIDVYNKKTNNALVVVNLPAIVGDADNTFITNAASFQNKGVELSLGWSDALNKEFRYAVNGNIAYNKNRIVGLNGGQALFAGAVGSQGFTTKSDNDQPIGSFFLLQNDGVFQTDEEAAPWGAQAGDLRYRDISGPGGKPDGKINEADRDFSGSYQPKVTYGFGAELGFRSFDLSIGGYGTAGGKIYNGKKATRGINPRDNIEAGVVSSRWTVNNKSATEPRANLGNFPASTYFLESGSFMRINNITLGYTLPATLLSRYYVTSMRIYVTVQNALTFTHYSGFTPELLSTDDRPALSSGIELNAYPANRIFAVGIHLGL